MNEAGDVTAAPHPEEMRTTLDVRVGDRTVIRATARATPAGLATLGILASAVLLSTAVLVWAVRRRSS